MTATHELLNLLETESRGDFFQHFGPSEHMQATLCNQMSPTLAERYLSRYQDPGRAYLELQVSLMQLLLRLRGISEAEYCECWSRVFALRFRWMFGDSPAPQQRPRSRGIR